MPRESSRRAQSAARPTSVYRYYDRAGILIYVGITDRGITRNREHNSRAQWWPFVARQEVDHLPSRAEAEAHEKVLILKYRPPFNTAHNPDAEQARAAYLYWSQSDTPIAGAADLIGEIGRTLPLVPTRLSDDRFALTTMPDYQPVTRLLHDLEGIPVLTPKLIGRVISFERVNLRIHLLVERKSKGRPLPPLDECIGMAPIKFVSQRPVKLRLAQVNILPRVALVGPRAGR